jgi:hypothetical protein
MSAIEASDDEEEHHPLRHVTPDFETLARDMLTCHPKENVCMLKFIFGTK